MDIRLNIAYAVSLAKAQGHTLDDALDREEWPEVMEAATALANLAEALCGQPIVVDPEEDEDEGTRAADL